MWSVEPAWGDVGYRMQNALSDTGTKFPKTSEHVTLNVNLRVHGVGNHGRHNILLHR